MRAIVLVICGLVAVSAGPMGSQRIIGGTETTIEQHPEMVTMLFCSMAIMFSHACAGIVLNNRSILTAGHCVTGDPIWRWRMRVGSTSSSIVSQEGVLHFPSRIIVHPEYTNTLDNDVAIMHVTEAIVYTNAVRPARIAGPNYNLADNQVVWAAGWGGEGPGTPIHDILRHVQVYSVNQAICRQRYAEIGRTVTDNMLCSGVLDVGGRDQCNGDAGGALYHNGNVVGVASWGERCGLPRFPGVNARVSRFATWIQATA